LATANSECRLTVLASKVDPQRPHEEFNQGLHDNNLVRPAISNSSTNSSPSNSPHHDVGHLQDVVRSVRACGGAHGYVEERRLALTRSCSLDAARQNTCGKWRMSGEIDIDIASSWWNTYGRLVHGSTNKPLPHEHTRLACVSIDTCVHLVLYSNFLKGVNLGTCDLPFREVLRAAVLHLPAAHPPPASVEWRGESHFFFSNLEKTSHIRRISVIL